MWQANCSNYQKENHMIKSFNIESNEKSSSEVSPMIEITHFNDNNDIRKKETFSVGYFLPEAKQLKTIRYS